MVAAVYSVNLYDMTAICALSDTSYENYALFRITLS